MVKQLNPLVFYGQRGPVSPDNVTDDKIQGMMVPDMASATGEDPVVSEPKPEPGTEVKKTAPKRTAPKAPDAASV